MVHPVSYVNMFILTQDKVKFKASIYDFVFLFSAIWPIYFYDGIRQNYPECFFTYPAKDILQKRPGQAEYVSGNILLK